MKISPWRTSVNPPCRVAKYSFLIILMCVFYLGIYTLMESPDNDDYDIFMEAVQDDSRLVDVVRRLMKPPSSVPYNLSYPKRMHFSQFGQSEYADNLFDGKIGGFFVEVGAANGEDLSNSLFLERSRGWSGLLIEPEPKYFKQLLQKQRKAYVINAGLSLNNISQIVSFRSQQGLSKISDEGKTLISIKTFPLYTMLRALNINNVDFFSLDVEGDEFKVLKTIPWDKVTMKVICVEVSHVREGAPAIIQFLTEKGYKYIGLRRIDAWFIHKDEIRVLKRKNNKVFYS